MVVLRYIIAGDCYKGGDHMICLPQDYQKYELPRHQEAVRDPSHQTLDATASPLSYHIF